MTISSLAPAAGSIVAAKAAAAGHDVPLLEIGTAVPASDENAWYPTRWHKMLYDADFQLGFASTPQARRLAALKLAREIANDPKLVNQWDWFVPPLPDDRAWISQSGTTVQHDVDRATSVVDPELRVHDLKGLRVIDASVAPTPVTGNTAGVSMVIGAKGVALLLGV